MATHSKNRNEQTSDSADQNQSRGGVEGVAGNARDREMGRTEEPLGDRGHGNRTWTPPGGEQGISNRPGDAPVRIAGDEEDVDDEDTDDEDDDDDDFDEDDEEDEEGDEDEEPSSEDGGGAPT